MVAPQIDDPSMASEDDNTQVPIPEEAPVIDVEEGPSRDPQTATVETPASSNDINEKLERLTTCLTGLTQRLAELEARNQLSSQQEVAKGKTTEEEVHPRAHMGDGIDGTPIAAHATVPTVAEGPNDDAKEASKVVRQLYSTLPTYNGVKNAGILKTFITHHKRYLDISTLTERYKVLTVGMHLKGDAQHWFDRLEQVGQYPATAMELMEKLQHHFIGINQKEDAKHQLRNLRFKGSISRYNQEFKRLMDGADLAAANDPIPKSDCEKYFMTGLRHGAKGGVQIADALVAGQLQKDLSMEELMQAADRAFHKAGFHDRQQPREDKKPKRTWTEVQVNAAHVKPKSPRTNDPSDQRENRSCFNCGKRGHLIADCRAPRKESGRRVFKRNKTRESRKGGNRPTDNGEGPSDFQ